MRSAAQTRGQAQTEYILLIGLVSLAIILALIFFRDAVIDYTSDVILWISGDDPPVLYANPGYSMRINELPEKDSDEILAFLFEHQTKPEYRYAHMWEEGDVMLWEDIGTIHNAVADYRPDEHRLIKRCQVMATAFGENFAQP